MVSLEESRFQRFALRPYCLDIARAGNELQAAILASLAYASARLNT